MYLDSGNDGQSQEQALYSRHQLEISAELMHDEGQLTAFELSCVESMAGSGCGQIRGLKRVTVGARKTD
jgi:hypothetical protein